MKIFKAVKVGMFLGFLVAGSAFAGPYVIEDNYWGLTPGDFTDVISSEEERDIFDISNMEISVSDTWLTVRIFSGYFGSIDNDGNGPHGTKPGDLFISTKDGWSPYGVSAPYAGDKAGLGEKWEYAMVGANLYQVTDASIKTSDEVYGPGHQNYIYRHGQEVQYSVGENEITIGSESYSLMEDRLTYKIPLVDLGLSIDEEFDLGFHWTMTCANDVIEGGFRHTPTPEPSTMVLLSIGLIGVAAFKRRADRK